jgi:hypothetical protein
VTAGGVMRPQGVLLGAVSCLRKLRGQQQQGERLILEGQIKQVGGGEGWPIPSR